MILINNLINVINNQSNFRLIKPVLPYESIITSFILNDVDKNTYLINKYKSDVLNYIKLNKNVSLTEIMFKFELDIFLTKKIINKLVEEQKIIIFD